MNGSSKRYFEFDRFRLDPEERALEHDGEPIPLTPKVFDLLVVLVENNRHTIAKHELIDRIWSDSIVEENSLNRNISLLRRALGVSAHAGGYIKTVPKIGYRFEAEVRCLVEEEEDVVVERRTNYKLELKTANSHKQQSRRWPVLLVTVLAGAVITVTAGAFAYSNYAGSQAARKAEASVLYQRGRELWQNRSADGLHEATLLLENAVDRDPELAIAHSALADAYAFDARNWTKVEEVAATAIKLDPSVGNPHASLGFVRLFWQWNLAAAEEEFKRAVALSPDYATGHQWFGLMLASVGHFNEGLSEMQKAAELEPHSVSINADLCQMLYFVGRNFEGEAQCKRALEIDPNYFTAHSQLYQIYSMQGREREAFEAFLTRERIALNAASLPADFEQYRAAFDRGGLKEFWREHVRLRRRFGTECGFELAWVHTSLGEGKEAIVCLQQAVDAREFDLVFIYADPVLRRLGEHPEYDEIADRMMRSQLSRSID